MEQTNKTLHCNCKQDGVGKIGRRDYLTQLIRKHTSFICQKLKALDSVVKN